VVILPQRGRGGLERLLHRPALSLDRDQRRDLRSGRVPGRDEGQGAIGERAAEQIVLGRIDFDDKGELTTQNPIWYVSTDGK
jgi:hypothetical protein